MTATRNDIQGWLAEGVRKGATHVVVMVDRFDHEDYPVYVMPGQDPRREADDRVREMTAIQECYDLSMDLDAQLAEHRAMHFDVRRPSGPAGP